MKFKPIIIVPGEPNSVFFEIFLKIIRKNKFNSPLILITSKILLEKQIKFFKSNIKINELEYSKKGLAEISLSTINLINIPYNQNKVFEKISSKSNQYIESCFKIALDILYKKKSNKLINGPISKKFFLKKKFVGITEYLANKTKSKHETMIIYNKLLSVSPITTHLPLKNVVKNIKKNEVIKKIKTISSFGQQCLKKNLQLLLLV